MFKKTNPNSANDCEQEAILRSFKFSLLSSTVIPAFVGTGIAIGGALSVSTPAQAVNAGAINAKTGQSTLLPTAKPKPRLIQLAQCKPCNPCNPCAAKKKNRDRFNLCSLQRIRRFSGRRLFRKYSSCQT